MQNPGFSCPGSSSFSTDFVDKTSQDFLAEKLVNCLPLRNKLMRHQSVMVKKDDQHHFHLRTLHAGNVEKFVGTPYSLDLTLCDIFLFPNQKGFSSGHASKESRISRPA